MNDTIISAEALGKKYSIRRAERYTALRDALKFQKDYPNWKFRFSLGEMLTEIHSSLPSPHSHLLAPGSLRAGGSTKPEA